MGTSSNPRSPNTPPWRPVRAVLGSSDWPAERQSSEIWSAASSDRGGQLWDELGKPIIAAACEIAGSTRAPLQATQSFDQLLEENDAYGLVTDITRRALARSVAAGTGQTGFASELFSETVSYYLSRDLPSYVGSRDGVGSTSEAIDLKKQIRSITRRIALDQPGASAEPSAWKSYVDRVIRALREVPGRP